MADAAERRERMVRRQIAGRGIADGRVLDAMRAVPREAFVDEAHAGLAYEDTALPIAEGQTISQPYIVALMAEAAEIGPGDRVLEIGTGSGYGAAVLARLAAEVFTVERHAALARLAGERFRRLGLGNVTCRTGDGSEGWPEAAPFDAIVVTAGAAEIPDPLAGQLAVGGRLIMPVGTPMRDQRLVRLVRIAEDAFEEEDLGAVAFVPLVGRHGHDGEANPGGGGGRVARTGRRIAPPVRPRSLPELIRAASEPLADPDESGFAEPFDRFGEADVVLLGEATHGTSEFYRARAAITRRLVERHGFTIVAVEADWPDAAAIDAFVRLKPARRRREPVFARFPTWMWRNEEMHDFVLWMRRHNEGLAPEARASFHGLDIYSLGASIRAVLDYLDRVDPEAARAARERYGCLDRWQRDPAAYGRSALTRGFAMCEEPVLETLRNLLERELDYARQDGEAFLDAAQNARLVASAERYYRAMYYRSADSWNLRDTHMAETLAHLREARPGAKAVVWAHNSHVGDASATELGTLRDEINVGQLCRERWGGRVALVGFGTDRGTVAAASDWDGAVEVKTVRRAHRDSYERLWHEAGVPRSLTDLRAGVHDELRDELRAPRLERAIGVIYRPESELVSHYFDASLPRQFDAWVWFDETAAVTPIGGPRREGLPDTYPFGL